MKQLLQSLKSLSVSSSMSGKSNLLISTENAFLFLCDFCVLQLIKMFPLKSNLFRISRLVSQRFYFPFYWEIMPYGFITLRQISFTFSKKSKILKKKIVKNNCANLRNLLYLFLNVENSYFLVAFKIKLLKTTFIFKIIFIKFL